MTATDDLAAVRDALDRHGDDTSHRHAREVLPALDRLAARVEAAEGGWENCIQSLEAALADFGTAEAKVAALKAALREYGNHVPPCALWITKGDAGLHGEQHPCTCGFSAAVGEVKT